MTQPLLAIVDRLPLDDAVGMRNARFDGFFPSRAARDALVRDVGAVGRLRDLLAGPYRPAPAETVDVPKWGGGTRPVIDLTVDDRVIYDALVALLASETPDGAVHWTPSPAERALREASIAAGTARYVLSADVDACFEDVPHWRLGDELRALTSDDSAVTALLDLLQNIVGCDRGLPQGPPGSLLLGDVYLSIVDRLLARDGSEFVRFNDDYLLPASSPEDAEGLRERLHGYLTSLGLGLNPRKTRIWSREEYASGLTKLPARQAARAIAAIDKPWGDTYEQSRPLRDALADLTAARSPHEISLIPVLLRTFPHLTKQLARYVRAIVGSLEGRKAIAIVDDIVHNRGYSFDWQLGWLYHCLIPAESRVPPSAIGSAMESLSDTALPWFVRGRAAVLLSIRGELPATKSASMLADAPAATTPDLVAAMAHAAASAPRSSAFARMKRRPLYAQVVEMVNAEGLRHL